MRTAALLLALALPAANGEAATAYVSDQLVLGVYANPKGDGARLATLHSGATVETLAAGGETTPVRLPDGTTGWVKSAYLTREPPAVVRLQQVQDELDRLRATTPALADAAQRNELLQLKNELADAQRALAAATAAAGSANAASPTATPAQAPITPTRAGIPEAKLMGLPPIYGWLVSLLAAACAGYWLGHTLLARRIKEKFGGMKVY